jgi:hypothetical protein
MSYVNPNFKTKKELKEAVLRGDQLTTYNPSGMFPTKTDGEDTIEGPHYPQPHKWYARVRVANGVVVKVIS